MDVKAKRRWYQFSLRTLLMTTACVGGGLGLYLAAVEPAERQRCAAQKIDSLYGGRLEYADEETADTWLVTKLREWLPRDYFDPIIGVDFSHSAITDDDLQLLQSLPELQLIDLDGTDVTDAGVSHLRGLKDLKTLRLFGTQTTSEGTREFHKAHPQCEIFYR